MADLDPNWVPTCWSSLDNLTCACCDDNIPRIEELEGEVRRLGALYSETCEYLMDVEDDRDRLADAIRNFIAHEDTHDPGPYVKDGNWVAGLREKYPDGFLSCADEDCGLYWPCPVAELSAALDQEDDR